MEINEFLKNNPKEYDLSNDGANDYYCNMKNGVKKFFAYMIEAKKDKFKDIEIVKTEIEKCGTILLDPDNASNLVQEIYKILWNVKEDSMRRCIIIKGDTLNSANTTVDCFYKYIEENIDKEVIKHKNHIYYILHDYLTGENSEIINEMINNEELEKFVRSYHTIGNFMPIPVGSNVPRGKSSKIHDYLDLTLLYIYNYYMKNDYKGISYILNQIKNDKWLERTDVKLYIEWLNDFGKGEEGWHNFIEKNYLEAFVNEDYFPKELWQGHFDMDSNGEIISVLPEGQSISEKYEGKSKCVEYFDNARDLILQRGDQMIKILKEKVEKR